MTQDTFLIFSNKPIVRQGTLELTVGRADGATIAILRAGMPDILVLNKVFDLIYSRETICWRTAEEVRWLSVDKFTVFQTIPVQNFSVTLELLPPDGSLDKICRLELDGVGYWLDGSVIEPWVSRSTIKYGKVYLVQTKDQDWLEIRSISNCSICERDLVIEYALIPCGHRQLCSNCIARMDNCPFCRRAIQQSLKLY